MMRYIKMWSDKYLFFTAKRMTPPMWEWPRKTPYFPSWTLHLGEWTVMIGFSRTEKVPNER
jgi:hypothetical protein